MMFQIDQKKVGCGEKVEMATINAIAKKVGLESHADAGFVEIDGLGVYATIDRVGRMTPDLSSFAEIAIIHAIGDLVVSGAEPEAVAICIEHGPEFETVEDMAALTSSLAEKVREYRLQLLNLHSVRSDYTYLTISAVGRKISEPPSGVTKGCIYLSRRIGASKMMVLRQLEAESDEAFVAEIIANRYSGSSRMNFHASDITGFGLAGAALNLSNRIKVKARISLGREHLVHPDVLTIPFSCFEAKGLPLSGIEYSCARAAAVARCIEFAGPVLIFVSFEHDEMFRDDFYSKYAREPLKIGTFDMHSQEHGVEVAWQD
jgi:selenophosphate synthase